MNQKMNNKKTKKILAILLLATSTVFMLSGCAEGKWQDSTLASFIVDAFEFILDAFDILISVFSLIYSVILDIFIGIWTFDFSFPTTKIALFRIMG
jgi:Co/Zn/Cd efflux system component